MSKLYTFLRFLKFFIINAAFPGLFCAAGADALGLGISDAPIVGLDDDAGGDAPVDDGTGGDPAAELNEDGSPKEPTEKAAITEKPAGPAPAKLSREAAAAVKSLKETAPAAFKEINRKLWALDAQDKKIESLGLENGLDSLIELKATADQAAETLRQHDLQSVEDAVKEVTYYRDIDNKLIAGDTSFIKDMPAEMVTGFMNSMPAIVGEWAQRDKDSYERYFGALVTITMRDNDVTYNNTSAMRALEKAGVLREDADPDLKAAYDAIKANVEWEKRMRINAAKVPEKKQAAPADDQIKAREAKVKESEHALAVQRVGNSLQSTVIPKMDSILKSIAPKAFEKGSGINRREVYSRAAMLMEKTLGQTVFETRNRFIAAGDEEGAAKYMRQQITDKRLTESLSQSYKYLYGEPTLGSRTATPGDKPGEKKPNTPGAPGQKVDTTFTQVKFNPSAHKIDIAATTAEAKKLGLSYQKMIMSRRAVLKGGKKVSWPQGAESEA